MAVLSVFLEVNQSSIDTFIFIVFLSLLYILKYHTMYFTVFTLYILELFPYHYLRASSFFPAV